VHIGFLLRTILAIEMNGKNGPISGGLGAPNPNFALQILGNRKQFGESFDGGWKTFRGSSVPENVGKIGQEMGEKLGAQLWGFRITDNTCAILNGEDARG